MKTLEGVETEGRAEAALKEISSELFSSSSLLSCTNTHPMLSDLVIFSRVFLCEVSLLTIDNLKNIKFQKIMRLSITYRIKNLITTLKHMPGTFNSFQ